MESIENKKLGLGIIAFEGTELIAQIVTEIRDLVDYVVVGFQEYSYTGDKCDPNDEKELQCLKEDGIIDDIIYIETNPNDFPRIQETQKRNILLQRMKEQGCTHELITDSDEFYSHDSFARAKQRIYDENLEITYCRYVNYFHDYTHYLIYPFEEGLYVPFIAKIDYHFAWQCSDFPYPSDPTRRYVRPKRIKKDPSTGEDVYELLKDEQGNVVLDVSTGKPKYKTYTDEKGEVKPVPEIEYLVDYYIFPWKELKMHHLSWIRANIRKKMNAWSSKLYFDNYLEIIDKSAHRFENFTEENKNDGMFLLFNTPGNKVDIGTFNKQYIFPKVDYKTRTHNEPQNYRIIFKPNSFKTASDLMDYFDEMTVRENYMNHFNRPAKRLRKTFDYIIIDCNMTYNYDDRKKLKDFVSRLQDDSKIYLTRDKNYVVISFESIQKVRKYYQPEKNINNDIVTMIKQTMARYCEVNKLNYESYIIMNDMFVDKEKGEPV